MEYKVYATSCQPVQPRWTGTKFAIILELTLCLVHFVNGLSFLDQSSSGFHSGAGSSIVSRNKSE